MYIYKYYLSIDEVLIHSHVTSALTFFLHPYFINSSASTIMITFNTVSKFNNYNHLDLQYYYESKMSLLKLHSFNPSMMSQIQYY